MIFFASIPELREFTTTYVFPSCANSLQHVHQLNKSRFLNEYLLNVEFMIYKFTMDQYIQWMQKSPCPYWDPSRYTEFSTCLLQTDLIPRGAHMRGVLQALAREVD